MKLKFGVKCGGHDGGVKTSKRVISPSTVPSKNERQDLGHVTTFDAARIRRA